MSDGFTHLGLPVAQFEVQVEDCMFRGDASHLASLLYYEGLSSSTLTRLDQLVTKVTGQLFVFYA